MSSSAARCAPCGAAAGGHCAPGGQSGVRPATSAAMPWEKAGSAAIAVN